MQSTWDFWLLLPALLDPGRNKPEFSFNFFSFVKLSPSSVCALNFFFPISPPFPRPTFKTLSPLLLHVFLLFFSCILDFSYLSPSLPLTFSPCVLSFFSPSSYPLPSPLTPPLSQSHFSLSPIHPLPSHIILCTSCTASSSCVLVQVLLSLTWVGLSP